jgi:hypothetical protein
MESRSSNRRKNTNWQSVKFDIVPRGEVLSGMETRVWGTGDVSSEMTGLFLPTWSLGQGSGLETVENPNPTLAQAPSAPWLGLE